MGAMQAKMARTEAVFADVMKQWICLLLQAGLAKDNNSANPPPSIRHSGE